MMALLSLMSAALTVAGTFRIAYGFTSATPSTTTTGSLAPIAFRRSLLALRVAAEERTEKLIGANNKNLFDSFETLDFVLLQHKPLGCTVEESLADPDAMPIFITKVVEGGFAEQAGLQVGDVVVGVTGFFGELSSTIGVGLDQVKKLVASTPQEEPLQLRIARGTSVMAQHETALVDLCTSPGANDNEVEQCMLTYLTESYADYSLQIDSEIVGCDDGTDCLLDGMWDAWNEDMPKISTIERLPLTNNREDEETTVAEKRPAPWSSRSSPSGTWVRDPKTGEMRNIDA